MKNGFHVWRPGCLAYRDALTFQERLVAQRRQQEHDLLMLVEHPPVVTFGRNRGEQHLLWSPEQMTAAGIDSVATGRGGDITLHNPGQLVGYPIVDLKALNCDLHTFLRDLERLLIATLQDFGLTARTLPEKTGVWVEDRKIASIGIAVRHWISWHGFALNIQNNLAEFAAIVPCGLDNVSMTSMQQELGRSVGLDEVSDHLVMQFGKVFDKPCLGVIDDPFRQNFEEAETTP